MPDDLDVLAGGVEYLQHFLVGHQFEERLEVDALGQRVDHDRFLGARHLHDAEQGIVGCLAQEFRIDGDDRVPGEAGANRREFRSGGNQIHEQSITLQTGRSAESADMSRGRAANSSLAFRSDGGFSRSEERSVAGQFRGVAVQGQAPAERKAPVRNRRGGEPRAGAWERPAR